MDFSAPDAKRVVSAGARAALASLRSEIGTLRGLGSAKAIDGTKRADLGRYLARPGIARALRETGEILRALGGDAIEAAAAADRLHSSESDQVSRRTRWADPSAPDVCEPAARAEISVAPWWNGARPVSVRPSGNSGWRDSISVGPAAPALNAIVIPDDVQDPAEVLARMTTNDLYYVSAWGHFAFCVGGVLFHAGIGETTSGPVPECRFRRPAGCPQRDTDSRRRCRAYHDPVDFPGAQEIRPWGTDAPPRLGLAEICNTGLDNEKSSRRRARRDAAGHDVLVALLAAKTE